MRNKKLITLIAALGLVTCLHTNVDAFTFYDTIGTRYEGAVERLGELKIINGVSEKTFNATKTVTRAEFAKMIVETVYTPDNINFLAVENSEIKFTDVPADAWYTKYVQVAVNSGYLNGFEDNTFRPNNEITYEQVAKILTKALGHGYLVETDPNGWATEYVKKMYDLKLNKGCTNFEQTDKATRGNVAIMLWNALTKNPWDYVWLNEKEGFTYMMSNETLFDRRINGYIYMENFEIKEFKEIDDRLAIKIGSTYYKFYDNAAKITFSMLGGKADALFRRVRYPDDEYAYEIVGLSTDVGSTLYAGTLTELKEEGYEVRNNATNIASTVDYGFYIDNEASYGTDRIVSVNAFEKRFYLEDVKVDNKKEKEIKDDEDWAKKIIEENSPEYTYYSKYTPSTKTITINETYTIADGALLFKDNVEVDWKTLKEGDILTEIEKDKYYFVNSSSVEVKIEDFEKVSNIYKFTTNKGEYDVYTSATFLGYFEDSAITLKNLKSNDLNSIKGKNAKFILDFAGRVARVELLQGDLSDDLLDIGLAYYSQDYYMVDNATGKEKHFVTIQTNKTTKRYEMGNSELNANPGDLLKIELNEENEKIFKNVSVLSSNAKINEKLSFKKTTYDELAKMKALGQIAENVLICESKYIYEFGDYEVPKNYELKTITLDNLKYVNIENSEFYMICDTEDLVRVIFVKDYSGKKDMFYGKVERIYKDGDSEKLKVEVNVLGNKEMTFDPSGLLNCEEGDLISFRVPEKDKIEVVETFSTEVLGYYRDLVIKTVNKDGTIVALNGAINLEDESITSGGRKYNLNNYTIIQIVVAKDEDGLWVINRADVYEPEELKLKAKDRIAIEEIEDTIVIYRGYKD